MYNANSALTYFIDVPVLVYALHQAVTESRALSTINDHLGNTGLLRRLAGRVAHEGDTSIGLHQAWVIWLGGVRICGSTDVDTTRRLGMCQQVYDNQCLVKWRQ